MSERSSVHPLGSAVLVAIALVLAACGSEARTRDDAGSMALPPLPPSIDASADRSMPMPHDAGPRRDLGPCRGDEVVCDGVCVNSMNDSANCGECGRVCPGDVCIRGECSCEGDGPGLMACGDPCVLVDTLNNPENCGACGNVCAPGTNCIGGSCECPDPLILCDGECVNTQSDDANCGGCGMTCASPDPRCTSSSVCLAGTCLDTCTPLCPCPRGCADFDNDPNNCGGCDVVVPPGFICADGAPTCPPGTRQCGDVCVALNDPRHCGGCGMVCTGACVLDVAAGTAICETCDADGGPCGFDSGVP